MTENNVERARRGWEAALRGELNTIAELLHSDVTWHAGDPSAAFACHNRVEALEFMRAGRIRRSRPELVDVVDAGDKVVVITRRRSEDGEPDLNANLTTFRDGKVIEMVHFPDPDAALAAAGVKRDG